MISNLEYLNCALKKMIAMEVHYEKNICFIACRNYALLFCGVL